MTACPVCTEPDCHYWQLRQTETWHPVTPANQTRPGDLPRGFAETGMPGVVELAAESGSVRHQAILEETRRNGFPRLMFDIPDGRFYDAGIDGYGEFFCSLNTAAELLGRDVTTLNGKPGRVSVVYRYVNGAQMKWQPA